MTSGRGYKTTKVHQVTTISSTRKMEPIGWTQLLNLWTDSHQNWQSPKLIASVKLQKIVAQFVINYYQNTMTKYFAIMTICNPSI